MLFIKFKAVKLPRAYSDLASRGAVLFPLTGWPAAGKAKPKEIIINKVWQLRYMWKQRLGQLKEEGWDVISKPYKQTVCTNCYPCFLTVSPVTITCSLYSVCPFCYGRMVQNQFRRIWTTCKGVNEGYKDDYGLLGVRDIQTTPHLKARSKLAAGILNFDTEQKYRRQLMNECLTDTAYVGTELTPYDINHPGHWTRERRGVLLVHNKFNTNQLCTVLAKTPDTKIETRMCTNINDPFEVIRLVYLTLRYPTPLMTYPDTSAILQILNARAKRRMYASYGMFRKLKPN